MMDSQHVDSRQSVLVTAMRFPLIVLVLFVHSLGFDCPHIEASVDGWNVFHFVSEMISHNLGAIAVCWFYVLSGYLFFYGMKEGGFGLEWVRRKWGRRARSLLIPYLFWNLLLVLLTAVKTVCMSKFGLGDDGGITWLGETGPLFWLWTGPADFPLYYVRDLMVMSLLAPVWYLIASRAKWPSLALLLVLYVLPVGISIPDWRALFFFGFGAWLGIWNYSLLSLCRAVKPYAFTGVAVLLPVATFFNDASFHPWLMKAFYPFGMAAFLLLCDALVSNDSVRETLISLSGSVFFIYAAHEIFILGWTKGLLLRIMGESLAATWARYLLVPLIVLAVTLLLYRLMNRLMPRTLAFVSGGRTSK